MNNLDNLKDMNRHNYWIEREAAYNEVMQPAFYEREAIGDPIQKAMLALSAAFGVAAVAAPITFGASMALPAVALVVAALVTLVATVVLFDKIFECTDPKKIVELEQKVVNNLTDAKSLIHGIITLKHQSVSRLSPDALLEYFVSNRFLDVKEKDIIRASSHFFKRETLDRLLPVSRSPYQQLQDGMNSTWKTPNRIQ